ncbi:MAG TPA: hypothetical protein VK143_01105 [Burkholderiales bacterium]|nr:hypothetical protein [Burkholderiales bacterium]
MKRRDFMRGAALGALAFTVGGAQVLRRRAACGEMENDRRVNAGGRIDGQAGRLRMFDAVQRSSASRMF